MAFRDLKERETRISTSFVKTMDRCQPVGFGAVLKKLDDHAGSKAPHIVSQ